MCGTDNYEQGKGLLWVRQQAAVLPVRGYDSCNVLWSQFVGCEYDQVIIQLSDFSVTFSQSPADHANHIIPSLTHSVFLQIIFLQKIGV